MRTITITLVLVLLLHWYPSYANFDYTLKRECKENDTSFCILSYAYSFLPSAEQKTMVTEVLKEIENATCIRFTERSVPCEDCIHFSNKQGHSFQQTGKFSKKMHSFFQQTGIRNVTLVLVQSHFHNVITRIRNANPCKWEWNGSVVNMGADSCWDKVVIRHKIMHALGFHHEQQRHDRDHYVNINPESIREDKLEIYRKLDEEESETFNLPYDVHSVLHTSGVANARYPWNKIIHQPISRNFRTNFTGFGGDTFSEIDLAKMFFAYCPLPEVKK